MIDDVCGLVHREMMFVGLYTERSHHHRIVMYYYCLVVSYQ